MALPPIVTNSPIFKILTGASDKPKAAAKQDASAKAASSGDTVKISASALKKLDAETQEKARVAANDVRETLEQNPGLALSNGRDL